MSGVSCVLLWNPLDGKANPQALEGLTRKVELLGGERIGRMHVESAIYFATRTKSTCRNFQVLTSTDFPASCFVLTENNTMLVADLAFREFAGYLKHAYQRKKKLQVEGKGIKYRLGDFVINFVTLFMGQSATVKGYVVEVIFEPSCAIHLCDDILRAFITQVLPDLCPSANDQGSSGSLFGQSFHRAVQAGSFDSPGWPHSGSIPSVPLTSSAVDVPYGHACARLAMTQYAEHMNTIRRLSRQVATSAPAVLPMMTPNPTTFSSTTGKPMLSSDSPQTSVAPNTRTQ